MKKDDFKPHTRYTVTWSQDGKLRPANLYVYRLYDNFMIVRMTDGAGLLRKMGYDEITRIVKQIEVPETDRFFVPEAVLKETTWATRSTMERYSSSPHMGK